MSMSGHPVFHSIEWRPICVLSLFIRRNCDLHTTAKHPVCVVHKHTCVRLFTGHTGLIRFSSCRHRCCGSGFGPASWLLHCKNRTHTHTLIYTTENVDLIFGYKINWYSITRNLNLDNKWPLKVVVNYTQRIRYVHGMNGWRALVLCIRSIWWMFKWPTSYRWCYSLSCVLCSGE